MAINKAAQTAGWDTLAEFRAFRVEYNSVYLDQIGPRQYAKGYGLQTRPVRLDLKARRAGWETYKEYAGFRRTWNATHPYKQIKGGAYKRARKLFDGGGRRLLDTFDSEAAYRSYRTRERAWEKKHKLSGRLTVQSLIDTGLSEEQAYYQHSQIFNKFASSTGIVPQNSGSDNNWWRRYYFVDILGEATDDEWDRYGAS